VTSLTHSQLLNQQQRLLTQSCHNDDADENGKLATSINGHHSVQNGDRKRSVSVL